MKKTLKPIWLLLCLALLGMVLYLQYTDASSEEIHIILMYGLLALCFPIGYLAALILTGIDILLTPHQFSIPSYASTIIIWAVFIGLGYFQWFKLLPAIIRKIKNSKIK